MLMRFDPYRDMDEMSRMFVRPFGQRSMPLDAYRQGDQFMVQIDLPGVNPESIDLTVEDNVLTVTAERERKTEESQEMVIAERPQGKFTRQLFLGESLDPDRIQASYDKGVLTLVIPVAERAKPRRIEVSAGNGVPIEATAH